MKKIALIFAFFALTIVGTFAQSIEFESTTIDYGTLTKGTRNDPEASKVFKFKNTGDAPLLITSARGSCGCTVPSYPKEPIAPGETGEVKVTYDIARVGSFVKSVTLTTNAIKAEEKTIRLQIKGNVENSGQ